MASIPLSVSALASVKKSLRKDYWNIRSSHLSEALAAALGRRTYAALLADIRQQGSDPIFETLDDERFEARLQELGYPPEGDFSFELLSETPEGMISTMHDSLEDIEYRTARDKAWRNLMVAATNEGIRQRLFSVRAGDNRWPGSEPINGGRSKDGWLFDFKLPNGLPARGWVDDIGCSELSIHVAVNPKGSRVVASNAGFSAGDAFATGWLEREKGAWLQSTLDLRCRKALLQTLADMYVCPLGFGDRGRVIT